MSIIYWFRTLKQSRFYVTFINSRLHQDLKRAKVSCVFPGVLQLKEGLFLLRFPQLKLQHYDGSSSLI